MKLTSLSLTLDVLIKSPFPLVGIEGVVLYGEGGVDVHRVGDTGDLVNDS